VRSFSQLRRTLAEIWGNLQNSSVQVAAALALGAGWLSLLDERLWGDVEIPFLISPWQSDIILLEPIGLVLGIISLLLVNGVIVPVVEEWLWRGLIQPRVTGALGYIPGLIITSVLFSFKHVIIDGSLGRMLTLTAFGVIMGITAARLGWRAAAMAHMLANTVATSIGLILSGGQL
jgi:membrane protease YdiL (CAAX protease family)